MFSVSDNITVSLMKERTKKYNLQLLCWLKDSGYCLWEKLKHEKFYEKTEVLLQWYFLACIFQEITLSDAKTITEIFVQVSRSGPLVKCFFYSNSNTLFMKGSTMYLKLGKSY